MNKPKGKTPSLLSQSTGMPSDHVYGRKTDCTRCKKAILKDEPCFQIPKVQSGFTTKKPFCLECFDSIINQTKEELSVLDDKLNLHKTRG